MPEPRLVALYLVILLTADTSCAAGPWCSALCGWGTVIVRAGSGCCPSLCAGMEGLHAPWVQLRDLGRSQGLVYCAEKKSTFPGVFWLMRT